MRHLEMGKDHYTRREGRHRRDRARRRRDDARRRRRVLPGRVHGRHDRQDLLPVRRHGRVRGARVAVRVVHARPDALEHLGRSRSRARRTVARRSGTMQRRRQSDPSRRVRVQRLVRARGRPLSRGGSAGRSAIAGSSCWRRGRLDRRQLRRSFRSSASPGCRTPNGDEFTVGFRTPPGSSLDYTLGKGREIADFLRKQPEVGLHAISRSAAASAARRTTATSIVRLKPKSQRRSRCPRSRTTCAASCADPGRAADDSGPASAFSAAAASRSRSTCRARRHRASRSPRRRVLEAVRVVPGVAEPNSSDEGDIPQLDVRVDRQQAWRAGLGISRIGATLSAAVRRPARDARGRIRRAIEHDVMVDVPRLDAHLGGGRREHRRSPARTSTPGSAAADDAALAGRRGARRRRSAADRAPQARAAGVDQQPACCPACRWATSRTT